MDAPFSIFAELPVGLRTLAGLEEELKAVGETEAVETLNGTTHILKPSFKRKWEVSLSNSGERRWIPDIDLFEPGSRVIYHALTPWSVRLTPGDTDAVLLRDAVPGSVHVRDAIDESKVINHGQSGRIVTIMGRAGHSRVHYRPILTCLVVSLSMGSSGRSTNWNLVLREEVAP